MSFTLIYDLEGVGWADARLSNGTSSVDVSISYLHDTLRELGEVANQIRRGATNGVVRFVDEPGEHHLVVSPGAQGLGFEVRWYDNWQDRDGHNEAHYTSVLSGHTTVDEFVGAVREQLLTIRKQYGPAG